MYSMLRLFKNFNNKTFCILLHLKIKISTLKWIISISSEIEKINSLYVAHIETYDDWAS